MEGYAGGRQEKNLSKEQAALAELHELGAKFGLVPNINYLRDQGLESFNALRGKHGRLADRNPGNRIYQVTMVEINKLTELLRKFGGTINPISTKSPEELKRDLIKKQLETLWPLGNALGIRFHNGTNLIGLKSEIRAKLKTLGLEEMGQLLDRDTGDFEEIITVVKSRLEYFKNAQTELGLESKRKREELALYKKLAEQKQGQLIYSNFVGEEVPTSALGDIASGETSLESFLKTINRIKEVKEFIKTYSNENDQISAYWEANKGSLNLTQDETKDWNIRYSTLPSLDHESCQFNYNPERPDDLTQIPLWSDGDVLGINDRLFKAMEYRGEWLDFKRNIVTREEEIKRAAELKKKEVELAVKKNRLEIQKQTDQFISPLLQYGKMVYQKCQKEGKPELSDKCEELFKSIHSIRPNIILTNGLPTAEHKRQVLELTNQFKQIDLQLRVPANVQVASTEVAPLKPDNTTQAPTLKADKVPPAPISMDEYLKIRDAEKVQSKAREIPSLLNELAERRKALEALVTTQRYAKKFERIDTLLTNSEVLIKELKLLTQIRQIKDIKLTERSEFRSKVVAILRVFVDITAMLDKLEAKVNKKPSNIVHIWEWLTRKAG